MNKSTTKLLLLLGVMLVFLSGCAQNTRRIRQNTAMDADDEKMQLSSVAVVTGIDELQNTVTLKNIETGEVEAFPYTGATAVYSKNKVAMTMSQLSCGEIVDAEFKGTAHKLSALKVSKKAWKYDSVDAEKVDRTENTISLTGRTYEYDDSISVFDDNQEAMLMDVDARDQISIRGLGSKVYSVEITRGHGFIRLGGHDAFVGGSIEVDQNIFLTVQQNMLISVSEGEHTVVLRNGGEESIQNVTVVKDQEYFLDLSEYQNIAQKSGKVKFVVTPYNAALYINGSLRRANTVLSIPYGNYNVTVSAEGYEDYTGILRVQKSNNDYETIYVDLAKTNGEVVTEAPLTSDKPKATPGATLFTTQEPSQSHTITITTPEGAEVYVDGVFKGVAPVSFEKVSGTKTITLSKEGYITRSYTVEVDTLDKDVKYSFADLSVDSSADIKNSATPS
ncbi:MAG: PEGA domain-containing protein [Lachnospiraceae bacterium]|nr:PEGA domain-containing protein [Lachnospiraceae bacterium]